MKRGDYFWTTQSGWEAYTYHKWSDLVLSRFRIDPVPGSGKSKKLQEWFLSNVPQRGLVVYTQQRAINITKEILHDANKFGFDPKTLKDLRIQCRLHIKNNPLYTSGIVFHDLSLL